MAVNGAVELQKKTMFASHYLPDDNVRKPHKHAHVILTNLLTAKSIQNSISYILKIANWILDWFYKITQTEVYRRRIAIEIDTYISVLSFKSVYDAFSTVLNDFVSSMLFCAQES